MFSIKVLGVLMIVLVMTFDTIDAENTVACEGSTVNIRCNNGQLIDIISANYGRTNKLECNANGDARIKSWNCVTGTTLSIVKAQCSNKASCSVPSSNAVFGEPCAGTFKYLQVRYQCVTRQIKTVVACENEKLDIACGQGQVIRVLKANFGRTNRNTCNKGSTSNTNCSLPRSIDVVRMKCGGKRECTVLASINAFSDPCNGTFKYLEVEYFCDRA